jgi:ABC-2 type transport system ATP-binding protein
MPESMRHHWRLAVARFAVNLPLGGGSGSGRCPARVDGRVPPVHPFAPGRGNRAVRSVISRGGVDRVREGAATRSGDQFSPLDNDRVAGRPAAGLPLPTDPTTNRRYRDACSSQPSLEPAAGLALSNLTRTFGARTVVNGLTLTAGPGQVVGLLGPNGCGKSTTMKMLGGVLAATSGTFTLDGAPGGVGALGVKARTGFIPDVGGLFPRLSAWEHLELCARLFAVPNWRVRGAGLLADLGLDSATHERAGEFSHGMSRKLSAAIALLPAPALLLADEPFDGVDASGIDALCALFAGAADRGAVVLVSTHLLGVAESLCDQVHLVQAGSVLAAGTPADLAGAESLAGTYERVLSARQYASR